LFRSRPYFFTQNRNLFLFGEWAMVNSEFAFTIHCSPLTVVFFLQFPFLLKLTVLIFVSRLQLSIPNLTTRDFPLKTQDSAQPRCALLIIPVF